MEILLLSDVLENDFGPTRPVLLLARELCKENHIVVASPKISFELRQMMESQGIESLDLGNKFYFEESSKKYFENALREAIWKSNSKKVMSMCDVTNFKIITFTCFFGITPDISYALGITELPIKMMRREAQLHNKVLLSLIMPLARHIDKKITDLMNSAKIVIAISKYCSEIHEKTGVKVDDVIYAPLDCKKFKPSTSRPSSDYVLSYIGKETQLQTLKKIADLGIKIKTFGSKTSFLPKNIREHTNIENLGFVDEDTLISLYSNAKYTIFPFINEFFGYIPIESMACGTPVLTYGYEGPGETVKDNLTGWLQKDDNELIEKARKLKKNDYPTKMRSACRQAASKFDIKPIAALWKKYLKIID